MILVAFSGYYGYAHGESEKKYTVISLFVAMTREGICKS